MKIDRATAFPAAQPELLVELCEQERIVMFAGAANIVTAFVPLR